jgi:hypothetical protein
MESAVEARRRWQALGEPIEFEPEDFEVLDLAVSLFPDLRVSAFALKSARAAKVKYPIKSVEELIRRLKDGKLVAGRHVIEADEIRRYMPEDAFPIEHEGELLSRVYAGLGRRKYEMATLSTVQRGAIDEHIAGPREVK